jgi:Capsule assembly protein Wzi/PAP2 superfamily
MAGTAAGLYLRGHINNDQHSGEAGLLAGEALVNSLTVAEVMKLAFRRSRPDAADGGSFGAGGASFPSQHAVAAWSMASVIAQEYPGPLTKLLAYGAASGISLSRITARKHFPSDVVVGSALGYLIGRQMYRAHHGRSLPDAGWESFDEKALFVRGPSQVGSPYVPLDSWVYPAFDRLAALGYAPSAFSGQRPWTRMECARLVESAANELSAGDDRRWEAYRLYAALKTEFATELQRWQGSGTSEVRLDSIYTRYTGIGGTPLDDGYHFGQTIVNDYGRPYGEGANVVSGASAWGVAGAAAFFLRGEYQHAAALPAYSGPVQQLIGSIDMTTPRLPFQTTGINQFRLLDAYGAWNLKSVQMSVGLQSLWWGPSQSGPLMYSDNAEPMDMLRLTNPTPWKLPGFFSWLGPMRLDFFFGWMAGHHYPANAAIDGQKISLKPTPNLEFGFSRTIVFRPVTLRMFWRGFSSVGDNKYTTPGSPADVGDRHGGFDFSYRIPGLRRWLVLYNDGLTDADVSPLAAPHRAIMNPGIYLPQIPRIPKLDLRVEAPFSDTPAIVKYNGHFFYWNSAFRDSYTNQGNLLGSWVGRQGRGLLLHSTYWWSPRRTLELGYREAAVDREFIPSGGHIRDFSVRARFSLASGVDFYTFVQHERWNFPVLSSFPHSDITASVELTYRPKWGKVLRFAQN